MERGQIERGGETTPDAVDRGGLDLAEQAASPLLQLCGGEQLHRLGQQYRWQLHARRLAVVDGGPTRLEIAPVVLQRAVDGDRCRISAAVLAARQFLCLILRPIERQHVLAVAVLVVVGETDSLGPVCAVAIAGIEHACAVGPVAPIHQGNTAR